MGSRDGGRGDQAAARVEPRAAAIGVCRRAERLSAAAAASGVVQVGVFRGPDGATFVQFDAPPSVQEPTTTPEDILRAAGISGKRQVGRVPAEIVNAARRAGEGGRVMAYKSAEEVERDHLQAMGPTLGPLYHEIYTDVVWLHAKWQQQLKLFAEPECVELLNDVAGFFFMTVQRVFGTISCCTWLASLIRQHRSAERTGRI